MCLSPRWIYKKGKYKEQNYRSVLTNTDSYEIGTFSKCGCCEQCLNEKANNWVCRCYYEARNYKNEEIYFITLTYAKSPKILVKKDLQNFIKRLRSKLDYENKGKIRFFASGEYGTTNTHRPHFHILMFGYKSNYKYLDINKKGNILYNDDLIKKCWKKGRISVQKFNTYEIPYTTLYTTAKEEFKRAYKLTREKCKKLIEENRRLNLDKETKKNLQKQLKEIEKELKKTKEKYYVVKEFNTWSTALGWEQFFDEYAKSNEHDFKIYIEDKEYYVPSPWLKKLANKYGDIEAANELFRREAEIKRGMNEEEEAHINELKLSRKRKKQLLDWQEEKAKIEEL